MRLHKNVSITHFNHALLIIVLRGRYACLVGNDFVIPNRKKIGGPLLELNFKSVMATNKANSLKEAALAGLTWLGDGATKAKTPFINVMNISGESPPVVVYVNDCTDHLVAGGKKDASYIADLFAKHVEEYDPIKRNTNLFFFDGASNVQKAGKVLTAK